MYENGGWFSERLVLQYEVWAECPAPCLVSDSAASFVLKRDPGRLADEMEGISVNEGV